MADLVPFFSNLGFVMKVETPVERLEAIEFCQSHPVFDGDRWRMVRNPHVSMSKDLTFLSYPRHQKEWDTFCSAISDCGLALTSGIPVLQSYFEAMGRGKRASMKLDERIRESGMFQLAAGLKSRIAPITMHARMSFYYAFGVTPDMQRALETRFNTYPELEWATAPPCSGDVLLS